MLLWLLLLVEIFWLTLSKLLTLRLSKLLLTISSVNKFLINNSDGGTEQFNIFYKSTELFYDGYIINVLYWFLFKYSIYIGLFDKYDCIRDVIELESDSLDDNYDKDYNY